MTGAWPCAECGAPTTSMLGAQYTCQPHREAILEPIREAVAVRAGFVGHGRRHGLAVPEFGAGFVELQCVGCEATWVGKVGDECGWCVRAEARMHAEQVRLTLTWPDVDRDDLRHDAVMAGWGKRLARAVSAGLVDRAAAERTLARQVAA